MRTAATIWLKELRDTIRDRRTLTMMIILPIALYPALIILLGMLAMREEVKAAEHVPTVAVEHADQAPQLVSALHKSGLLKVIRSDDARSEVAHETADVGLVIPKGFGAQIEQGAKARVTIIIDSLRMYSERGRDKVRSILREYTDAVVAARLGTYGARPEILAPFDTAVVDTATKEQRGGRVLSYILPMIVILWAIAGGMYTAMDVAAGEKERKTLEALLLTPASRTQIVLGKFLAVTTTATVAVVLSLFSMTLSVKYLIPKEAEAALRVTIGGQTVLLMLIPSLLIAAMFAAILIAVSIFAKSFKEAQANITPVWMAGFMPIVLVNILQNYRPSTPVYAVPVLNATMLFKEVLVGEVNPVHIAVTIASLTVFAGASIYLAAWLFGRESVMFRS
jgi:sodium transport system permease protein